MTAREEDAQEAFLEREARKCDGGKTETESAIVSPLRIDTAKLRDRSFLAEREEDAREAFLERVARKCDGGKTETESALVSGQKIEMTELGGLKFIVPMGAHVGDSQAETVAEIFSEMQMDEVYDAKRESVAGLAEVHVYKSIIGIPAEKFIEVLVHLSYFGYRVSVEATDTEVKFTTVNREAAFRNQPRGRAECFIGGVEPEHPISFSFSLKRPRVIIKACKLSNVVWSLYTDGPWPIKLNCPVG